MARFTSWTLLLLLTIPGIIEATNFTACRNTIIDLLTHDPSVPVDTNGTIDSPDFPDPIYHGPIFGFKLNDTQRPITLTYEGCKNVCTAGPKINSIDSAFNILTTWVLPVIALLSSLPYESNNNGKNFEAFANWIGSPAAALATTMWNLLMIRKCRKLSETDPRTQRIARDSLFILSCVNQYQYERRTRLPRSPMMSSVDVDRRRDKALLRGVLFPFLDSPFLAPSQPLRTKLENLTFHLAFQLRLQRRRGVYPIALSIIWFLLAFIVSVVTAFAQLGDNTTAHSLALGLLLSWLPILVVATVVDRNPVSATRCGILIERWLFNVDAVFAEAVLPDGHKTDTSLPRVSSRERLLSNVGQSSGQRHSISRKPLRRNTQYQVVPGKDLYEDNHEAAAFELSPISPYDSRAESIMTDRSDTRSMSVTSKPRFKQQWRQDSDLEPFYIQSYVGQGRRLRYCAVTDTVLHLFESGKIDMVLPSDEDAYEFKKRLTTRPFLWYVTWLVSQLLVTMSFTMAFLVSFNTPTIGLGCRSLSYLIWWLLSLISWVIILLFQEPPKPLRYLGWLSDVLAFSALFVIMGFQLTGGLNRCICKCSMFGSSKYGGYMDFENGEFYHTAYDVKKIWGVATAFGLVSCTLAIAWLYRRWARDSMLWKFREDHKPEIIDGVDLEWLT